MIEGRQTEKNLIGIAGVYFVAGELSKRGYIALVTSRNTKSYDILVIDPKTSKSIPLQVKATKQQTKKNIEKNTYIVKQCDPKKLDEELNSLDTTFIFVYFTDDDKIRYFIVNPPELRKIIKEAWNDYEFNAKHRKHIDEIKSKSQPLGPSLGQLFPYENKWESLK